jgi:hypothetical protein
MSFNKREKKPKVEITSEGWKLDSEASDLTIDFLFSIPPYTETKDESGGAAQMSCRVPDYIARVISSLKESNKTNYQIVADVVRDCLYVGVVVRCAQYNIDSSNIIHSQLNKMISTASEARKIKSRIQQLSDEVSYLMEHDDIDKALEIFASVVLALSKSNDSWVKKTYVRHIMENKSTKELLERSPKAIRDLLK